MNLLVLGWNCTVVLEQELVHTRMYSMYCMVLFVDSDETARRLQVLGIYY
jgi:hypothetical protein